MNMALLSWYFQIVEHDDRGQAHALTMHGGEYAHIVDGRKSMQNLRSLETRKLPNPFNASEQFFRVCFNLDKKFIEDFLIYTGARTYYKPELDGHHIPFDIRVLATLSFLVHGHVDFSNDFYDLKKHKNAFLNEFNVPGVIGVIDCFFVRLSKIHEKSRKMYTCRQGYTAVKVQVICDPNMRFMDVNLRHPGGAGDIYIWNRSHVRHMMQHLYENDNKTWIVADRGYRLEAFLMNRYRNAVTNLQNDVNLTFKKVHSVLDKAIAILRSRFSCLNMVLGYNHKDCSNIITSCITLHNYMIANGYTVEENLKYNVVSKKDLPNTRYEDDTNEGIKNREFVNKFIHNNNQKYAI